MEWDSYFAVCGESYTNNSFWPMIVGAFSVDSGNGFQGRIVFPYYVLLLFFIFYFFLSKVEVFW